jgi:hypothetical protein
MRTGFIPFESDKPYGLTENQREDLNSIHLFSPNEELDTKRITAMADRVKSVIVRLCEDVAKFAKTPLEGFNLILALKKGLAFGFEKGEQVATSTIDQLRSPNTTKS